MKNVNFAKKILVLTSGHVKKLDAFKFKNVKLASFDEVNFSTKSKSVFIGKTDLSTFDLIYFRLVGKSLEIASVVADYAKEKGVKLVDKIYEKSHVFPITQSKAMEMKALSDAGVSIPKTYFGSLKLIKKNGEKMFGFPYVLKATSGSRGREVYSPKNNTELNKLLVELGAQEKAGKKFFAQEFIPTTKRIRVLVVGGKVIGSISQLTKWRKRIGGYKPVEDEVKIQKHELSSNAEKLAIKATNAVSLDICGVDILKDSVTNKTYVIETNAAPSWKLINKYCQVSVEDEIVKFLKKNITVKKSNKSNKLYKEKFEKHGVSPKALLWKSKGAAHQRFREFWKEIDFNNKKVLDIGCGFGEMGKFLLKRYEGVDYTGIDILPEFIKEAKKQVPGGEFFVVDFLKDKIDDRYDIVIASGVLNSNSEDNIINGDNMNYRRKAITKMFELTKKTLAFNMLGAHPQPKNNSSGNVWYADSLEILEFCMSLTRRVVLRANYHLKDFTIIMKKVK